MPPISLGFFVNEVDHIEILSSKQIRMKTILNSKEKKTKASSFRYLIVAAWPERAPSRKAGSQKIDRFS
jgi:hypothetical protein